MAEYPNVQVTYTQGAPPNLFMKDADGNVVEEIGISNWKLECVLHAPKCPPCARPPACPLLHASHALHATSLVSTAGTSSNTSPRSLRQPQLREPCSGNEVPGRVESCTTP